MAYYVVVMADNESEAIETATLDYILRPKTLRDTIARVQNRYVSNVTQ